MVALSDAFALIVNHDGADLKTLGSSTLYTDPRLLRALSPAVRLVGYLPCGAQIITSPVRSFSLSCRTFTTTSESANDYSVESTMQRTEATVGPKHNPKVGVVIEKALCLSPASGVSFCEGPQRIEQYMKIIAATPLQKQKLSSRIRKRQKRQNILG